MKESLPKNQFQNIILMVSVHSNWIKHFGMRPFEALRSIKGTLSMPGVIFCGPWFFGGFSPCSPHNALYACRRSLFCPLLSPILSLVNESPDFWPSHTWMEAASCPVPKDQRNSHRSHYHKLWNLHPFLRPRTHPSAWSGPPCPMRYFIPPSYPLSPNNRFFNPETLQ